MVKKEQTNQTVQESNQIPDNLQEQEMNHQEQTCENEEVIIVPYCSDEVLREIAKSNPGKKVVNPVGKELIVDETGGK